jgi:hypothetical protein
MKLLKAATTVVAAASMVASAWGQTDKCLDRTLPLSIISWDGSPLPGLGPQALEASITDIKVKVNSLLLDQEPRRILLLMDISASFLDKSDPAIGLGLDLVDHIPPPSEIGLASFAGSFTLLAAPAADRTEIRSKIQSVFPPIYPKRKAPRSEWGTALWDAVRDSADLLGSSRIGDVIFVITNGSDNSSKGDSTQATRALLAKGIRLFAIEIPDSSFIRARESGREGDQVERMRAVTDETGGFAITPFLGTSDISIKRGMSSQLRNSLNLQYHLILNFYRIDVTLSQPLRKQLKWKLSLTGVENSARKNYELNYPKSLLPCD